MNRGDVCWYAFKASDTKRPALILTLESAISVLNSVNERRPARVPNPAAPSERLATIH
jgi:hypothetical protein